VYVYPMSFPGGTLADRIGLVIVDITGDAAGHDGRYAVLTRVPGDVDVGSSVELPTLKTTVSVRHIVPCPAGGPPACFVGVLNAPSQNVRTLVLSEWFHYPTP
jgi:hypothetical protein